MRGLEGFTVSLVLVVSEISLVVSFVLVFVSAFSAGFMRDTFPCYTFLFFLSLKGSGCRRMNIVPCEVTNQWWTGPSRFPASLAGQWFLHSRDRGPGGSEKLSRPMGRLLGRGVVFLWRLPALIPPLALGGKNVVFVLFFFLFPIFCP